MAATEHLSRSNQWYHTWLKYLLVCDFLQLTETTLLGFDRSHRIVLGSHGTASFCLADILTTINPRRRSHRSTVVLQRLPTLARGGNGLNVSTVVAPHLEDL